MENQQSFWQFSDQLRLHSTGNEEASNRWSFGSSYLNNFANLSINENVWSNSHKENSASNISINDNVWANSHKNNVPNLSINDSGWSNSQNSFPNLSTNEPHKNNVPNLSINDSDWSNSQKNRVPNLSTNDNVWSNSNKGNNVSNLWINDSVWPNINNMNTSETRRNLDTRGGKTKLKGSEMNAFNDGWKHGGTGGYGGKGVITNNNSNKPREISKNNNKSNNNNSNNKNSKGSNNNGNSVEKRFKTLPPSESLPRNETLGGYIFVCNNDTMEDDLRRLLFGLPQRYRDSVRSITPGLPLFLYNYSTHQLHGVFEAASFGGTNIDPTAWEDKKCPGESRFPAQVRAVTRKICKPLEEDSFRPVLHHYDGPKFRLQLNIPEALALLDIFADNNP